MVGNRSYTGKWGIIKLCLQNLDTQKLLPSRLYRRTPDLICPCSGPFLDSPFPWRRNPVGWGWMLWHRSRQVPDFYRGELRFSRKDTWPAIRHPRASTGCMHCWLRPSVPPVTGWVGTSSGKPCCWGSDREMWQHRGCSTSFVTSIHVR